jgi:hypothetical protein
MGKDNDVAGREHDGVSVFHLDERAAFHNEVIEDEVRCIRSDLRRHQLRPRRRDPPGR